METEPIEPALGILESAQDIAPCEALVVGGITVCGKPCLDDRPLLTGQEAGRVGIVVDEEVGANGDYDGS